MGAWVRAAHVVRTKNLQGSVVCHAAEGLPFLLHEGLQVHFVPPTLKGPRQACVESLTPVADDVWEVHFAGIDTIDDAEQLVGCTCLALASQLPNIPATSLFEPMVGCTLVEAEAGPVGIISAVRPGPAQSLLVVTTPEGDEVLIPAVDAFLGPIDHQTNTVHATLPSGLLSLGREEA